MTDEMNIPDIEPDEEERPYLVVLSAVVRAYDPSDAAQVFSSRLAIEGLAAQSYRVLDVNEDEQYVVEGTEVFEYDAEEEGEILDLEAPDAYERLMERLDAILGGGLAAITESAEVDDEPAIVDVELPEPEDKPKKKAKKKKQVTGTCKRCHTEEVVLNDSGICEACAIDIQGAPS